MIEGASGAYLVHYLARKGGLFIFPSINQLLPHGCIIIGLEKALSIKHEGSMRCLGYIQGDQCELHNHSGLRYLYDHAHNKGRKAYLFSLSFKRYCV